MKKKQEEKTKTKRPIPREIIAAQRLSVNTAKETAAVTLTSATVKTIDV